jgi:hypothetical protein
MTDFMYVWSYETEEEKAIRHVRSAAGARRYKLPIGSPIPGGSAGMRPPKPTAGRALKASEKRVSTPVGSLKPGDSVVTHGSGVGRAVRAVGPSAGEVRKVKSVEDAEKQFGPSGKGKTVVRFEDGSFSTPSAGSWDLVQKDTKPVRKPTTPKPVDKPEPEKPTETAKKPADGPRLLTVEQAKQKKERDAADMAERMKGIEIRRGGALGPESTVVLVNGKIVGQWADRSGEIARSYQNNPERVAQLVVKARRSELIERFVKEEPDMTLQEWLDSDGGKKKKS